MMNNSPVINWRNTKKLKDFLGKKGKVIVWTKIHAAPSGFEHEAPYFTGLVEFEDRTRKAVQFVECGEKELKEGLKIITVVRRFGKVGADEVIDYVVKAKPLPETG